MNLILPLLAGVMREAAPVVSQAPDPSVVPPPPDSSILQLPNHWPMQGDLLAWCHATGPGLAVLLIIGGIIFLLFGYHIFKILVTLNAAVLGGYFGAVLGEKSGTALPAAIVGALLAAAATWPMMKYAVAVMGGIFGALLGATIWRLANLDPTFAWSGAMTGLVTLGLLSFLLFRQCVMTYTSLQGSVMLVFGILALIFKYDQVSDAISHSLEIKPFLLPLSIFIPTLLGFIYQQTMAPGGAPPAAPAKK
jgi:hypothetical protein